MHYIPEQSSVHILPTAPGTTIEDSIVFVPTGSIKGKGVRLTALQRGLVETYVRDVTKPVVRAWGGNDMHVRVQFSGYGSWTAVSADIPVQGLTRKELGIWVYTLILQSVELCRRELPLSNEPRSLSFRGNQPLAIDDLFVFGLSKVSHNIWVPIIGYTIPPP